MNTTSTVDEQSRPKLDKKVENIENIETIDNIHIKQIEIVPSLADQCLHSQLKQLTPEARKQLLENIAKEEEALEEARQKAKLVQEAQNTIKVNKCHYGVQMTANTHAIMNELRGLRQQVHDLKMHMSQLTCQRSCQKVCNDNYECEEMYSGSCTLFSFEWLPFWVFIAFILFALTVKPRVKVSSIGTACSSGVNGLAEAISSCPKCPFPDLFSSSF